MKAPLLALFFYGGPDQLMPLTSGLAAILAFLLIFWNKTVYTACKVWDYVRRRGKSPSPRAVEPSGKPDEEGMQS